MAFDANFLSLPRLERETNKRFYKYRTADSLATIVGSGYFAGCADGGTNDRDMQLGDEILCEIVDSISAPTALVPIYFAVSSISSTDVSVSVGSATPDSHTHAASDIVSGTLAHERGGLEADVSAYDGLLKVSGGATSQVTAATGWGDPTGTATRTAFASFAGQSISASPTQGEVQNIDDHVVILSERLGALITDLKSKGYLAS